jgi:hypothetical protein
MMSMMEHTTKICSINVLSLTARNVNICKFFQDVCNIALGMLTDSFTPFCHHKKTCWPILFYNYNLPLEIHFLLSHILCVGVIPGSYKPKDFDSFFWPAMVELIKLAISVATFDTTEWDHFSLCTFLILVFGDIPAISMVMKVKGHNRLFPCQMCKI